MCFSGGGCRLPRRLDRMCFVLSNHPAAGAAFQAFLMGLYLMDIGTDLYNGVSFVLDGMS